MSSGRFSRLALWSCGVILLTLLCVNPKWKKARSITEDVIIYYSYVPAVFIHGDVSMKYGQDNAFYADKMWGSEFPDGSFVQKYTCGLALMYTPFFLLSHGLAKVLGYPADGYSPPYHFGLALAAIVYVFLGLLFLRKLLLRYFSDKITAITLLAMLAGTNLLYFTAVSGAMPHSFLFFLIILFSWCTLRFHETGKLKFAIWMSLAGGLAFLIRPPHILIWLMFLLYGVTSRGTLVEKLHYLLQMKWRLLVLPLGTLLLFFLQMCYWKKVTGQWLWYSYGDENFFWNEPLFAQVLFSFRKGWFIYTPMMLLAIIGFFRMGKFSRAWLLPLVLYFSLSLYIISCWWCWWYGGTLGQRSFIDFYGLLALPFAAILTILSKKKRGQWVAGSLLLLFTCMNVFQTIQYTRGVLHHDAMNRKAWAKSWTTFDKADPEMQSLLTPPDVEGAKKGHRNFW